FPAPISLGSPHHPFELPITSRCDDLPYPAFSQIRSMFAVLVSYARAGRAVAAAGRLMIVAGKGKWQAKK
ncbi:hypothetical protein, partial [Aeromonas dhakensis]|uniref:hypothetical protein n=1 Tax=Aeromonas dhakensis TaxID=196024 RepID=UPI001958351E